MSTGRAAAAYELYVWPSVAGTGWAALVSADAGLLWRADGWRTAG